jgi:hypothetical protein
MSWETLDSNLVRITKQDYGNIGRKVAIISLESIIRRVSATGGRFVSSTWDWFTSTVPTTIGELILADYDLIVYTRVKSFDESCGFLERVMEALLDIGPHFLQFYIIVGVGYQSSMLYEPNTGLIEDRIAPIVHDSITHLTYVGYSRTFLANATTLFQSMRKMTRSNPSINCIDPNTLIADDDTVNDSHLDIDDPDIPAYHSAARPSIKRKMRQPYIKTLIDPQTYIDSAPDLYDTLGQIKQSAINALAAGNKQVTIVIMGGRLSGRSTLISKLKELYDWPNAQICVTKGHLTASETTVITPAAIYVHMVVPEDLRDHMAMVSARLMWHRQHEVATKPRLIEPVLPDATTDPYRRAVFIPFVPIFHTPYERLMFTMASIN